jgi:hypothetical protein
MNALADLVQTALATTSVRVAPVSVRCLPPLSSRVWRADVIQRFPNGCHLRVGEEHDVFVPPGYVPEEVETVRVRVQADGPRRTPQSLARSHHPLTAFPMNMPRRIPSIEALESRIALAALAIAPGGKSATFTDVDGDLVTVKVTKGQLDTNDFMLTAMASGYKFELLNFADDNREFDKTDLSIVATPSAGAGDGHVNVAYLNATDNDLGIVVVDGDLGRVTCGNTTTAGVALKSLVAGSIATFDPGSSAIAGGAGAIKVLGSIGAGEISVTGPTGSFIVGGSLMGGDTSSAGHIQLEKVGFFKLAGSIFGGKGAGSGTILLNSALVAKIGGDLVGGEGFISGGLGAQMLPGGSVEIRGLLHGSTGSGSGQASISGVPAKVTVGGLEGSDGAASGELFVYGGKAAVTLNGPAHGGAGDQSGSVNLVDGAKAVKTRSLIGGAGKLSGAIYSKLDPDMSTDSIGVLTINGDVVGGAGGWSGSVSAGQILVTKIAGSVVGGSNDYSGYVQVNAGKLNVFNLLGDVRGGSGFRSGTLELGTGQGTLVTGVVNIGGSIVGGSGSSSGSASYSVNNAVLLRVGGSIVGGSGSSSGTWKGSGATTVVLGGSVIGGSADFSGYLSFVGADNLRIGGSVVGSDLPAGASDDLDRAGALSFAYIGKGFIGGSIYAGTDFSPTKDLTRSGIIYSNEFPALTIAGSVVGSSTDRAQILAGGSLAPNNPGIGKLTIGGRVDHADILAGYVDIPMVTPFSADVPIGTVTVNGDWVASNLVAGVGAGADGDFGTVDDQLIAGGNAAKIARIASVIIKGQAIGTVGGTDHYGIVAEKIDSLKVGGVPIALTAGTDIVSVGPTTSGAVHDFLVREDV